MDYTSFALALLGIIWIDLLLSGDNAVVIALVCRQLPPEQQRTGMIFGTGAAIALRIVMALCASFLMSIPYLSTAAGLFLVYVAINMLASEDEEGGVKEATTLMAAVMTIAVADAGMSLDNVFAVAALANGHWVLMSLGIIISIPFVIAGSAIVLSVIGKFPQLVWAGAGLLGWVAGGIIAHDIPRYFPSESSDGYISYMISGVTLAVTLLVGAYKANRATLKLA